MLTYFKHLLWVYHTFPLWFVCEQFLMWKLLFLNWQGDGITHFNIHPGLTFWKAYYWIENVKLYVQNSKLPKTQGYTLEY